MEDNINELILLLKENVEGFDKGKISDGYHSFSELYEFRKMYNVALFNEWGKNDKYSVHKSRRHEDGELCFDGGYFIVSAMLPSGLISNHYKLKDWDLFNIKEVDRAIFKFDGHTGQDVLKRLARLIDKNIIMSHNTDEYLGEHNGLHWVLFIDSRIGSLPHEIPDNGFREGERITITQGDGIIKKSEYWANDLEGVIMGKYGIMLN